MRGAGLGGRIGGGLGYLLAQQLLAAGERVVDVPATLASRVRLLGTGRSDKNDPNDARSVAIAALRAPALTAVRVEDHATCCGCWRRHSQIAWGRNKAVCRLHALVCELVRGGITKEVVISQAFPLLENLDPTGAVGRERHRLALELLEDIARYDTQRKDSNARIRVAVARSSGAARR